MLTVSWIFFIHNMIVTIIPIGILSQLFFIKIKWRTFVMFVLWIQLVFIFNDYVIQPRYSLQWKYPVIFAGFFLGFYVFVRLKFLSTLMVMIVNLIVNGIATNMNMMLLLMTQYDSYGQALDGDFIQYTSLVMVMIMVYILIKTFDIRFVDISRYD